MKRVLLVDDDLDVLESLEMVLERNYEVRTAVDGVQALASLDIEEIDVAVIDLMMPGMDGDALINAMRARGIVAPIILASATPELAARSTPLHVFAALAKPFSADELERCIAAALASTGGPGGAPGPAPASSPATPNEGPASGPGPIASARTRHPAFTAAGNPRSTSGTRRSQARPAASR